MSRAGCCLLSGPKAHADHALIVDRLAPDARSSVDEPAELLSDFGTLALGARQRVVPDRPQHQLKAFHVSALAVFGAEVLENVGELVVSRVVLVHRFLPIGLAVFFARGWTGGRVLSRHD